MLWCWGRIKKDDVIVANHPNYGRIIKRVREHHLDNYFLEGDNLVASTSAAKLGSVNRQQIVGKVIWRIKPCRKIYRSKSV
ncbi:hypothetical protein Q7C_2482 [Methylophaga frappieri]|uniref:Peptidase S24/S26A/S26B/S26C domain-containing protein n=2 Tax=Methylophaga frappieri (strain ATCC BAA-2434 / DSM 25690 / JAM7) TaxID=754477 RepID=I1YL14_METFJ|nr:hypothetical protein Q7C_2482 [Methylophaga frappieri]